MSTATTNAENQDIPAVLNPFELILMMFAVAGGAIAGAVLLPLWLPGLTTSLLGTEPKAFWYLARASGVVAYLLLWLTLVFGLVVSNKMARLWNGGPTAVELHQFGTWMAIAFSMFHALILMGDHYIRSNLQQVLTPFGYVNYQPFWVGLGQVGFYTMALVAASFYVRKQIGYRVWRTLHYVSFVLYLVLTLHGIFSGTDTNQLALWIVYAVSATSVFFLTIVRILSAVRAAHTPAHAGSKPVPRSAVTR